MLTYGGINTYESASVKKAADAIVMLDLNEKTFMLAVLADLEQAQPSSSLANHSFYKGKF